MKILWKNSKGEIVAEVKKLQFYTRMGLQENWTCQVYHGKQGYYAEFKYPSEAEKKAEELITSLGFNDVYKESPSEN